jgi:hypothetical protein
VKESERNVFSERVFSARFERKIEMIMNVEPAVMLS